MNQQVDGTTVTDDSSTGPTPEERASRMGWKPEDQYKGDKPWVSAEAFLERSESAPVLKAKLNKADARIAALEGTVREVQTAAQEFRKLAASEAERKWQDKFEALAAAQAKAVEQADGEAFQAAQADILKHQEAKPTPVTTSTSTSPSGSTDPVVIAWEKANPWFFAHVDMNSAAVRAGQKAHAKGLRGQEVLDAMRDYVVDKYPEEFEDVEDEPLPRKANGATPHRGGRTSGGSKNVARTYENLPPDDQKTCDQLIKTKMVKDRKQFCEMYNWS